MPCAAFWYLGRTGSNATSLHAWAKRTCGYPTHAERGAKDEYFMVLESN